MRISPSYSTYTPYVLLKLQSNGQISFIPPSFIQSLDIDRNVANVANSFTLRLSYKVSDTYGPNWFERLLAESKGSGFLTYGYFGATRKKSDEYSVTIYNYNIETGSQVLTYTLTGYTNNSVASSSSKSDTTSVGYSGNLKISSSSSSGASDIVYSTKSKNWISIIDNPTYVKSSKMYYTASKYNIRVAVNNSNYSRSVPFSSSLSQPQSAMEHIFKVLGFSDNYIQKNLQTIATTRCVALTRLNSNSTYTYNLTKPPSLPLPNTSNSYKYLNILNYINSVIIPRSVARDLTNGGIVGVEDDGTVNFTQNRTSVFNLNSKLIDTFKLNNRYYTLTYELDNNYNIVNLSFRSDGKIYYESSSSAVASNSSGSLQYIAKSVTTDSSTESSSSTTVSSTITGMSQELVYAFDWYSPTKFGIIDWKVTYSGAEVQWTTGSSTSSVGIEELKSYADQNELLKYDSSSGYTDSQLDLMWSRKSNDLPLTATLTIPGSPESLPVLARVLISAWFNGVTHYSSGYYIITKISDSINGGSFITTFSLLRINSGS